MRLASLSVVAFTLSGSFMVHSGYIGPDAQKPKPTRVSASNNMPKNILDATPGREEDKNTKITEYLDDINTDYEDKIKEYDTKINDQLRELTGRVNCLNEGGFTHDGFNANMKSTLEKIKILKSESENNQKILKEKFDAQIDTFNRLSKFSITDFSQQTNESSEDLEKKMESVKDNIAKRLQDLEERSGKGLSSLKKRLDSVRAPIKKPKDKSEWVKGRDKVRKFIRKI